MDVELVLFTLVYRRNTRSLHWARLSREDDPQNITILIHSHFDWHLNYQPYIRKFLIYM